MVQGFNNKTAFSDVMKVTRLNKARRVYPQQNDPRMRDGLVFPDISPRFSLSLDTGETVFTIGSCFAREIERALSGYSVHLPTQDFSVPKEEWKYAPNGMLNEYTPGTIAQRIHHALDGRDFPVETIVPSDTDHCDLLLPGGADVTVARALERRKEISEVYSHLPKAQVVIITLGYVEAWYDNETGYFLNRIPPHATGKKLSGRFDLIRLDTAETLALLEPAILRLSSAGLKTLLTVSPVPLQTTLGASDCTIANEYSKSVLRVVIDDLIKIPNVDYFPSYEIVRSGGMDSFLSDQIHVRPEVVAKITAYMLGRYRQTTTTEMHADSLK